MTRHLSTGAAAAACVAIVLVLALPACDVSSPALPPAELDRTYFECAVQPVLSRECSFPSCHGNAERPFEVLSPGRMRLSGEYAFARTLLTLEDAEDGLRPPLTEGEIAFNYEQARAFVRPGEPVEECQLLLRPLAPGAGGIYHAPHADVFDAKDDARYDAIARWIAGETAQACP